MHDVLEGALQYEVKLMLQFIINSEGYFTLEIFNSHLVNPELGYMESNNKPTVVSQKILNSVLLNKMVCLIILLLLL